MNPIFKLSPKAQYEIGRILYGKYMLVGDTTDLEIIGIDCVPNMTVYKRDTYQFLIDDELHVTTFSNSVRFFDIHTYLSPYKSIRNNVYITSNMSQFDYTADFGNYWECNITLDHNFNEIGGEFGSNMVVKQWCNDRNISLKEFPQNYDIFMFEVSLR